MRKIDSLKAAILTALPELGRDPDRLRMWIERGAASATQTTAQGFTFSFQLNVLVVELASDIAVLTLAVLRWLRINQPDLIMPGTEGFSFDADILDSGVADVLMQLQLDQAVAATPRDDGGFDLDYRDEPTCPIPEATPDAAGPAPAPPPTPRLLTGIDIVGG